MSDERIRIGVISAAHGIRGEVKIRSFAEPPEAIFSYDLTDKSGKRAFTLTHKGGTEKAFIAEVKGVTDRNEAERLKGTELFALAEALPKKLQLVGHEARLENGRIYGRITQRYNFGAGDIIEIELVNGKTEMLPLTENFVQMGKGFVTVFPPDYVEE